MQCECRCTLLFRDVEFELALGQVSGNNTHSDALAHRVLTSFAGADQRLTVLLVNVVIVRQGVLRDEAFAFVVFNFNKKSLRNDAIDDAVKRLANAGHEELDLLVFDGGAFCFGRTLFHVGAVLANPHQRIGLS